ncbi:MAG: hypothetical protein INH41_01835 [Myxococcaceae bacterium]|jgi:hypothetical protein|nr:hypothetical protein [Myxococcaceae bacterium]
MHTPSLLKVAVLWVGFSALAAPLDRPALGSQPKATCNCKNASDCTCPRGQCKCKNCGAHHKATMFESLKGTTEKTQLPDTARHDARGGVFI